MVGDDMKKCTKYFFLLILALAITEMFNGVIVFGFNKFLDVKGEFVSVCVSLILYFIFGKVFFSRITDNKSFNKSVIYVAIMIVISYIVSLLLTVLTGSYFLFHMAICSPVGNLLAYPFSEISGLYELLLFIFSPISVLLIWLFSKIGNGKKNQNDLDI